MENCLKKDETAALKGVAIFFMLFHHCYRVSRLFSGYDIIFSPFSHDQVITLGHWTKICVSLFAFVSGYGLYISYIKKKEQSVNSWATKRIVSTLSGYWFVAVFMYIVAFAYEYFAYGGEEFAALFESFGETAGERVVAIIADILGVSTLLKMKCLYGAWWYIGTAVVLIILLPILMHLEQKIGSLCTIVTLMLIPRILKCDVDGNSTYPYILIFFIGMLCCKYGVFKKFHELRFLKNHKANEIIKLLVIVGMIVFGILTYDEVSKHRYWWYHFAFIPFIVIIFFVEYIFRLDIAKKILAYLGNNSLNIWIIHTFFRNNLGDVVWGVKWFILCPLVLLILSLITAIIVDKLKQVSGYNRLMNRLLSVIK